MKYIPIILLCLCSIALAQDNQLVIFSGEYSYNGWGIDADTAFLFMGHYDTIYDSIIVPAYSPGLYKYMHSTTAANASGWYGEWQFRSNPENIRVPDKASVAMGPDSGAVRADISLLALEASLFDYVNDKVTLVDSSADGIHDIRHEEIVNIDGWNPSTANLARDATKADYKATGFSTHSDGDVWDLTTDGHTGAGTFGKMLESCSTGVAGIKVTTDKLMFDGTDSLIVSGKGIAGGGGGADTTDIKAALQDWLDKLVSAQNLNTVRYISPDGDNSNGLSVATAWTDFDSIGNLNDPTTILVTPGTYTEVACTVRTSGIELIGVGGAGITALRGTADTTAYQDRIIVVNPRDTAMASLRISGFNFAHEIPDETADPNFKCAIYIQDSVRYVEIDNNLFIADSNFKTIATASDYIQYLYIHDNIFAGNRVHAIDVAPEYSVISNNYFMKMGETLNDGVRRAIQLYTGARWNIIEGNFFTTQEVGVSMVGADSNLVADNYFGINDEDASEMAGDANAAGNVFTGNHGAPHIKLRESAGGDEIGTWEDRFYNMMKIQIFQPPTLSVIPNGDLQLVSNAPDSTIVEGWGNSFGTVYITGRRSFGALPRSLYMESPAYQNTNTVYLHKGLHQVSIWAWLDDAADEARITCYNDGDVQQNWADGGGYVSGTGYTGWQRIGGTIYLSVDDYYYFSLGTPDSTYLSGFTVHPDISGDSANAAIVDANKTNFKADVSSLSTLTASDNIGINADDITGDFAVADFEGAYFSEIGDTVRAAIHDSLYQQRVDSILSILGVITDDVLDIAYYWGACDGCYYRLYPEGGLANKDSAILIDPSLGVDSMVGKVIYLHGTDDAVVDTSYFYRDEPW